MQAGEAGPRDVFRCELNKLRSSILYSVEAIIYYYFYYSLFFNYCIPSNIKLFPVNSVQLLNLKLGKINHKSSVSPTSRKISVINIFSKTLLHVVL